MRRILLLAALAVAACGGGDDGGGQDPAFTCSLGSLTGTWRTQYAQTSGTCGTIADETATMGSPAPGGCTYALNSISDDRCQAALDFTCPTLDDRGTQRWVVAMRQTSPSRLEGTATLHGDHATFGSCRSTYAMTMTRLQ